MISVWWLLMIVPSAFALGCSLGFVLAVREFSRGT